MTRIFELRTTPTDVVLRALAIASVTFNHAHMTKGFGLAGGMTFLLMLSGLNFARFAVKDAEPEQLRRSIVEFARRMFVPSMLLLLFSFAAYRQFNLSELLFVRNWFDMGRVAIFYAWYPQMLLQLLAGLYLLTLIPFVGRALRDHPTRSLLILFGVGLLLRAAAPWIWEPPFWGMPEVNPIRVFPRLPHLALWNFALGGVIYFLAIDSPNPTPAKKWLAFACVLAGATLGWEVGKLQFWWLAIGGALLVGVRHIALPRIVAQAIVVVSVATFTIFLTHIFWFKAGNVVYGVLTGTGENAPKNVMFVIGLVMGTLTSVAISAFARAYRKVQVPAPNSGL